MLYQIRNGTVSLQGEIILDHFNFEIKGKEKIALVGKNGSGKTTLLRAIGGQISLDREDKFKDSGIHIARNTTIGMLPQHLWDDKQVVLEEEVDKLCAHMEAYSKERFDFEQEYDKVLTGFGFEKKDKYRKIQEFSGGEQTKLAMIQLLLQKPDLLILDEPTNHLDADSIAWLEEYIRQYPGAVLYVSHDRYFIDQTAQVIYEVNQKKLRRYAGNYTDYRLQKETEIKTLYKQWKHQQEEKERLGQTIERFKHKPTKASMTRSKKKMLARMPEIKKPDLQESYIYPQAIIPERLGSKNVFQCKKLLIGYEQPLREININIRRGQKIGILGKNGSGKTTFLKTIQGQIPALQGQVVPGTGLEIAYFSQLTEELPDKKRVIEYYQECFPNQNIKDAKGQLSRFHFSGNDFGKKIQDLSGGERAKLTLCTILTRKPNVLLLDEPTNHMDIPSKEVIESALDAYEGTIVFISHDRYFIKKIAKSLLLFKEDDTQYYAFSYENYLQQEYKKEENLKKGIFTMNEENAALLESYEAVPVKKRMQASQMTSDQAFVDWQLELAQSELQAVQDHYEKILEKGNAEEVWESGANYKAWITQVQEEEDRLTQVCLLWYEKYLEYKEYF